MKISKKNLEDISCLIFDGFLVCDVFLLDTYFTIRTLKTDEREKIFTKYKYLTKTYNFYLIIELLSASIKTIGGIEIEDRKKVYEKLLKIRSSFVMFLYRYYSELEERTNQSSKFLDFYIESSESKYYWNLFKGTNRLMDLENIKKINQFQYYWIVMNSYKDVIEDQKREWSKTEYMTNSICAFVNPKEFRRLKGKMNVSDKFEADSKLDQRNRILAKLEKSDESVEFKEVQQTKEGLENVDQEFFDQIRKKENESKDEYVERLNKMMARQIKGEITDDHDHAVRVYELNLLKRLLLEKRIKIEVSRKIREQKKFEQMEDMNQVLSKDVVAKDVSYIGDFDAVEKIEAQEKEKGYYHDGVSYLEIVNEKAFVSIPKIEKEKAFKEVMEAELDLDNAVKVYLEKVYKDKNKGKDKPTGSSQKPIQQSPDQLKQEENTNIGLTDKFVLDQNEEEFQNAAEKAAKMNVDKSNKDFIQENKKQGKEKMGRYYNAMDKRDQFINRKQDDDTDQMFFN